VALTRITGVLVCEVGRRDNWYDAYIYTLARETCPGDTPSGGPGCHRHAPLPVFTPPRRVADYTTALSLVHIPTTTNGAEALGTLQSGALMEVVGSHVTNHNNHNMGEEFDITDGAAVTPLNGPAPQEILRSLELPASRAAWYLPGGVPAMVDGVATTPIFEDPGPIPFTWFLLRGPWPPVRVVLFNHDAADLPVIEPGARVRVSCVYHGVANPEDRWYPWWILNSLEPYASPRRPPAIIELHGGPRSRVEVV